MSFLLNKINLLSLYEMLLYASLIQLLLFFCALFLFVQPRFLVRVKNEGVQSLFFTGGVFFLILNFIWATVCGALYQLYLIAH